MTKGKKIGNFNWDNNILTVNLDYVLYQGGIYYITWVNDLCFYHSQGNHFWYYIWDGKCYHCIKYKSGFGFREIHEI